MDHDFDDVIDGLPDSALFAQPAALFAHSDLCAPPAKLAAPVVTDANGSPYWTAEELAHEQNTRALLDSTEDVSRYFRLPLPSLDALAGAMVPGQLWAIGARQGNGKSLFAQNVAAWALAAQVPLLYMGTEQTAATLRRKQACMLAGVSARLILNPTAAERASGEYEVGRSLMQNAVRHQLDTPDARRTLMFSNDRYINREALDRWVAVGAGQWGARIVIVDHIHMMEHGNGSHAVEELTRTILRAADLACDYGITMILMSQIKRTMGDPMQQYVPPSAEDFAGSSAIERVADVLLTLWRPLRQDLASKALDDLRASVRSGALAGDQLYEPMTMGVRCVKDRLGDAPGRQTTLAVANGRITERGRDAYKTDYESMRHV